MIEFPITIDATVIALMIEGLAGSIIINIIAIRSRMKLIKNGYVKGKKYEFWCKPLGDK